MEHKTVYLSDQVFERIEADILSGKYSRGEILTELKLVETLGVSRTPIREALRRLEQENLIEETGKGAVVVGIDKNDLEDIRTVRYNIEGIAASRAAERITDAEIDELRRTVEMQEFFVEKHDSDRIKSLDSEFHERIFRYSGSSILAQTLLPLHKKLQKYRKASVEQPGRAGESAKEHRGIFEAIAARDPERAGALMRAHIENAMDSIIKRELI